MRLCGEMIRKAKAQVELYLVAALKEKDTFLNISAIKEGLWKISVLFWIPR